MSVIALSHITKDYGGGHGVFDVSFAVEQGWAGFSPQTAQEKPPPSAS